MRRVDVRLTGKCKCTTMIFWLRGTIPNDRLYVGHAAMIECPACGNRLMARITHVFDSRRKKQDVHE